MGLTTAEFWKLCLDGSLLSREECQQREAAYRATPAANVQDPIKIAQWLVSQKVITAYQAKVLLSGRPGPFVYGEYKVYDLISSGRRSGLFRATHMPTGHRVALYALSGPGANERARITLAKQKIEVARRAAHPLLLACHELVEIDGMRFIALEDLAGQSLEEQLAARGSLPVAEACRMGQLSALALTCLHDLGQAHGEIRPANIWLGKSGEVKVLQVPLSRDPLAGLNSVNDSTFDAEQRLSAVADYMAPELTQMGRAPHPGADVYALGCAMYQVLSGRVPFAGGDWRQKSARHATEPPEPLARIGVPVLVSKLVLEMLAKDPAQRPPMLQLAKHLVRHAAPNPAAKAEPPSLNVYERLLIQRRSASQTPPTPAQRAQPAARVDDTTIPLRPAPPLFKPLPAAPPVQVDAEPPPAPTPPSEAIRAKRLKQARQQYAMLAGALLFLLCTIIVAAVTITSRLREPEVVDAPPPKTIRRPPPPPTQAGSVDDPIGPKGTSRSSDAADASSAPTQFAASTLPSVLLTGVDEIEDDGHSLWASPTQGSPLKLRDVAPGLQWFCVIRPAAFLEELYSDKVLATIGPAATRARDEIEAITGVPCAAMDRLTIAGYVADEKASALSFVVRMRSSIPLDELRKTWKEPPQETLGNRTYYRGTPWAYYLPPGESDEVLVVADPARVKQIIEADGAPPLPSRLEWLLGYTDSQRMLTVGFIPADLTAADGPLGVLPPALRDRCTWLVGDSAKAGLFSAHLDRRLFIELRLRANTDDPNSVIRDVQRRLVKLNREAGLLDKQISDADYTKSPPFVLAQMVRLVCEYMRIGVEDEQAVARWYLPGGAAVHLVAAVRALNQGTPETSERGGDTVVSVGDRLAKVIDLSFPRETLESAVGLVSREAGVPIEILGSDLQLEGITKNHAFGFDEHQQPAREILQKILWQASPDGKLVYVIKSKQPGQPEMVFVTTRAAARRRGDAVPPEFDSPK